MCFKICMRPEETCINTTTLKLLLLHAWVTWTLINEEQAFETQKTDKPQLSIGTKLLTATRKIPKIYCQILWWLGFANKWRDEDTCVGEALWSAEVEWMTAPYQQEQQPSFLILHDTHPMQHLQWLQSANRIWRVRWRTLGVYWMATLQEL
jgi:hypothetical protein